MKTKTYSNCIEVKSAGNEGDFTGYASVYNVVDSCGDIVLPGAFRKTLERNKQVQLLWQHDPKEPIGYFTSVSETVHGLHVEGCLLMELTRGHEVYLLMKAGIINGLSIGFEIEDSYFAGDVRYIKQARLWEVSLVTFPASNEARVTSVKSDGVPIAIREALERSLQALKAMPG